MADCIDSEVMHFRFRLQRLSAIDYRIFLSAANPEEKMLGILGNFGERDHVQVVTTIVKEVLAASSGDFVKDRHLKQLRILANLRNLGVEINTVMESVAKWFKIERDPFYQRGQRDGKEIGKEEKALEVVKALLLKTQLPVAEIAGLVNVTEDYVRRVKRSLKA